MRFLRISPISLSSAGLMTAEGWIARVRTSPVSWAALTEDALAASAFSFSSPVSSLISVVSAPKAFVVAASVMMTETLLVGSEATSNRLPRKTGMARAIRRTSSLPEDATARRYFAISSTMTTVGLPPKAALMVPVPGAVRCVSLASIAAKASSPIWAAISPQSVKVRWPSVSTPAVGSRASPTSAATCTGPSGRRAGSRNSAMIGGPCALGEVVDGCQAVRLPATERSRRTQDAVLPSDALRTGDAAEGLRQQRLQARSGVGLGEEGVGVAVDRVVLGVADDLVQLRREVVVREPTLEDILTRHTHLPESHQTHVTHRYWSPLTCA